MKRKQESFSTSTLTVSYGKIKIWSRVADDRKPKKDNIGEKSMVSRKYLNQRYHIIRYP